MAGETSTPNAGSPLLWSFVKLSCTRQLKRQFWGDPESETAVLRAHPTQSKRWMTGVKTKRSKERTSLSVLPSMRDDDVTRPCRILASMLQPDNSVLLLP